jgi:tripartite-type tricarboxylate transporter receptor subunit TctC
MIMLRGCHRAGLALIATLVSFGALAQADYPNAPVRMIVPFAPGGASDFVARVMQKKFGDILGQQIVIENKGGAAGNIGMDAAARAAPDGYTLFLGNIGTVELNPFVFKDLKLKPLQDFIAISQLADMPSLLIVNKDFPPNTVKELIDYVKARPGKINFASPGSGSLDRLEMELFRKQAGLDMTHVPYKGGAGPAVQDTVAGHVQLMFGTIASTLPQVVGGNVKALAVTSTQRIATIPNVPTIVEAGYPDLVVSSWQGLLVPTGTPQPIVDKLHAAVIAAMKDPDIIKRFGEVGALAATSPTPRAFVDYIQNDAKKWQAVIAETGAAPD